MTGNDDIKEKGYLHETFRLFHNTDILGTDAPAHFHTFYKVTFVKYGRGSYMIDGRTYDIQSGDIILVGINVPHRPVFEAGELYDRYTVYISSGLLERFDTPECHICELFSSAAANVIRPEKKDAEHFIKMFERIETEKNSTLYGAELASEIGVLRFLIEAARCRKDSSFEVPLSSAEDDRILKVLRLINENLKDDLNLKDTASRFEMDPDDMIKAFKETFGCTMDEYIINRRLSLAHEMIVQGMAPAEVCYECGYKSIPVFNEAYRKKFGTAPKRAEKKDTLDEAFYDYIPE
ncbi:MAG: AraC family transcriptional regulator [Lachnospiraceae bacterium]|nr:AraC family transcriptional regulator [Lachnospiraceae bacterium]